MYMYISSTNIDAHVHVSGFHIEGAVDSVVTLIIHVFDDIHVCVILQWRVIHLLGVVLKVVLALVPARK